MGSQLFTTAEFPRVPIAKALPFSGKKSHGRMLQQEFVLPTCQEAKMYGQALGESRAALCRVLNLLLWMSNKGKEKYKAK